jgi:hypothetical protein
LVHRPLTQVTRHFDERAKRAPLELDFTTLNLFYPIKKEKKKRYLKQSINQKQKKRKKRKRKRKRDNNLIHYSNKFFSSLFLSFFLKEEKKEKKEKVFKTFKREKRKERVRGKKKNRRKEREKKETLKKKRHKLKGKINESLCF